MVRPRTTYRCRGCGQLLPFDHDGRVPDSCVERCEGRCDWVEASDEDAPRLRGER